jgi:peptidase M28-like protein/PDZ domain-containing protein/PA domain-containing protein
MSLVTRPARALVLALLTLLASITTAPASSLVPPPAAWLLAEATALTAPEMEGRRSGTPGGDHAARHLADAMTRFGLRPAGDGGTFLQSFVVSVGTRLADPNALEPATGSQHFALGRDWMPHGGSPRADISAEVVAAGHGIVVPEQGHDDYAGVDVSGRIVLVVAGAPAGRDGLVTSRLDKLIAARQRGAAAVLVAEDALPGVTATATAAGIPSASVTRATGQALTARPGVHVRLQITLGRDERRAANVVGILPGRDPALAGETIVIGAHYDHLGRVAGAVHHGADDNASGTAVVLGLARAFAAAGGAPRTLVFALFAGEELGLLGSRHYVSHPRVPLSRTVAMLNLDMVGRLENDRLHAGGVDTGSTLRTLVAEAAHAEGLNLSAHGGPWAPSDHLRFYGVGTPVLFFHTGRHRDYHQPSDTADKLNADGMARIAAMAARVVARLGDGPPPRYVSVPPPQRGSSALGTAFFGVMADGHGEGDGLRVMGVVPGSAAERAGVAEGDVIVRFAGIPVAAFDEFQRAVRARRPGDRVSVLYLRNGEAHVGEEALGARP